MNILIEIETRDEGLASELKEAHKKYRKAGLPPNATLLEVVASKAREGTHFFMLTFGIKVDTGLIANWLYEKLRDRATKLRMDRIEVQINKSEIERVILEKIGIGT